MYNCEKDILAYHNDKVTLAQPERTAMRDRRDTNRERLEKRLKADGKPSPNKFIKQGSYAMLTMVQDSENDYDIDDGVYFSQESLEDSDGNDMTPYAVRKMVREVLKDERFNKQPGIRKACVRIYYNEGYHVDMPIYRIRTYDGEYELAHSDDWDVSRAADVEDWFNNENQRLSPDESNGRQFRRIVRDLKKFARSRNSWKPHIATGFTITKLASECFASNIDREDKALRDTMASMYNRLCASLEVNHPVTPGTKLTKGPNDASTTFLRDRLEEALDNLAVLDNADCTRKQALTAWDNVFNTSFFSSRLDSGTDKASAIKSSLKPAAAVAGLTFPNRPVKPNKPAGFA